jgi:phage/plasmid-associated DNA primase
VAETSKPGADVPPQWPTLDPQQIGEGDRASGPERAQPAEADGPWTVTCRVLPFRATMKRWSGTLEGLLQAEASGILNWLIEGARLYTKRGLGTCDVVEQATANARRSSDSVRIWIEERCRVKADAEVQASAAYESYRKLCRTHGRKELSVQAFARAMNSKGHHSRATKRHNVFAGLELRWE